jgi:hypothetical protein
MRSPPLSTSFCSARGWPDNLKLAPYGSENCTILRMRSTTSAGEP